MRSGLKLVWTNLIEYLIGGVILIGGQSGNKILDSLYELTSVCGSWKEMASKLKMPRRNLASWTIPTHLVSECSRGVNFFFTHVGIMNY